MFFTAHQVNQYLTCQVCFEKLFNPKILPCGETICESCCIQIEESARSSRTKGEFMCRVCSRNHQVPEEGFLPNVQLSKLLSEQAKEVIRGAPIEALKERLRQLEAAVHESVTQLQLGLAEVSETCFRLRNRVQLETEQAKEFIDNHNEKLIGEIDDYERKCREAFEKDEKKNKEILQKAVDEQKEFLDKWFGFLQQFRVDESQATKAIDETNVKLENLQALQQAFRQFTFGEKRLEFQPAPQPFSSDHLGKLDVHVSLIEVKL